MLHTEKRMKLASMYREIMANKRKMGRLILQYTGHPDLDLDKPETTERLKEINHSLSKMNQTIWKAEDCLMRKFNLRDLVLRERNKG
jgi:hypothetical protein